MTGSCEEFDRLLESGGFEGEQAPAWRAHLAGCADCREQARADVLLREMQAPPPPELSPGFEVELRRRLERRAAAGPAAARPAGRLRPSGFWTLAIYGTAAVFASVLILSRLPWQAFTAPPGMVITLGLLTLLSPLLLVGRLGLVRPPG